jgi:hypothetical protein
VGRMRSPYSDLPKPMCGRYLRLMSLYLRSVTTWLDVLANSQVEIN